jgi:hypothetical protein
MTLVSRLSKVVTRVRTPLQRSREGLTRCLLSRVTLPLVPCFHRLHTLSQITDYSVFITHDGFYCLSKWLTRPLVTKLQSLDSLYLTSNMCPYLERNHILYKFHGNIPHFMKKIFIYIRGKGRFTVPLHTLLFKLSVSTNQFKYLYSLT